MSLFQKRTPCQICKSILLTSTAPCGKLMTTELGTVANVLSNNCPIHHPLLMDSLKDIFKKSAHSGYPASLKSTVNLLNRGDRSFGFTISGSSFSEPLLLSNSNSNLGYKGLGKIVHPQWIDVRLLRAWKTSCDVQHDSNCHVATASWTVTRHRPSLVIDTWRLCLTKCSPEDRYVALSYVWGQTPTLKTVQANLQTFQQPLSLGLDDVFARIPKTVRDAIVLTDLLHERYLWVDSLCIVQDNDATLTDQINKMASIYANAILTIIAADGEDANHGLCGIKAGSNPRQSRQRVFKVLNGAKVLSRQYPRIERSTWSKRGWTFQESLFSRRKLFFCDGSIMWQCPCDTLYEDFDPLIDKSLWDEFSTFDLLRTHRRKQTSMLFAISWPDITKYQEVVSNFNQAQLTYPEDIVDAFSGITTPLSIVFQGGFFYGLPEMFFDIALLWKPWKVMKRRIPQRLSNSTSRLPSWSWMGWHGAINSWSWHSGADYIKRSQTGSHCATCQRTVPLVQWYIHDKDRRCGHMLGRRWDKYKYLCLAESQHELPSGWTQYHYEHSDTTHVWFPEYFVPCYFFKHESDDEAEFWYPIPIPQTTQEPNIPPLMPYISGRTSRCWLKVNFQEIGAFVSLRDSAGAWAGALNLHSHEDLNFQSEIPGICRESLDCELIVISGGYAYNRFWVGGLDEWDHKERPRSYELYEFYNVLWIRWEDGIAYRRGLGRVEKRMWEAQKLEWIDITLG